ncbi:hypothetical protein ACO2RV_21835 [Ancylobacter sp. VNQ12]|uniref:hypothetical protein n=1 Tax=Ancylobacter sp. VNQ12 TaxID=3400920 RepID=UPI003BFFCFB3
MTTSIVNRNNMRALRLVTATKALEDIYHEHMTGPCLTFKGEAHCGLPEAQANLLWLLLDTAAREARELQAELEAAPEDAE